MNDRVTFICANSKCGREVRAVYGQAITMRCACGSLTFNLPKREAVKKAAPVPVGKVSVKPRKTTTKKKSVKKKK